MVGGSPLVGADHGRLFRKSPKFNVESQLHRALNPLCCIFASHPRTRNVVARYALTLAHHDAGEIRRFRGARFAAALSTGQEV